MRLNLIMMGAALAAGVAWMSKDEDDGERVVLTGTPAPVPPPPVSSFGGAMPQFGDPHGAVPPPTIARISAPIPVLDTEVPMTESGLRAITQREIAMMKAAGIGMDAQGMTSTAARVEADIEADGFAPGNGSEDWTDR